MMLFATRLLAGSVPWLSSPPISNSSRLLDTRLQDPWGRGLSAEFTLYLIRAAKLALAGAPRQAGSAASLSCGELTSSANAVQHY